VSWVGIHSFQLSAVNGSSLISARASLRRMLPSRWLQLPQFVFIPWRK